MGLNSRFSIFGLGVALVSITLASSLHAPSSGAGSALCMPGLSIRCEPDDCGSQYVRCGRNEKRQEVPENKVCYKGTLISVNSRLLPQSCRERTFNSRNSTVKFDLKACNCPLLCSGNDVCVCYCLTGSQLRTTCSNNGQVYSNPQQARCCLPTCRIQTLGQADSDPEVSSWRYWSLQLWTEALDMGRAVIRFSSKQMCETLRNRFTFPPTMQADACCTRAKGNKCNQC